MMAAYPNILFETGLTGEPAASAASLARSPGFRPANHVLSARSAIDLKRDLRRAAQEREVLASKLALLHEEFDARVAEELIANERGSQGIRLLPARIVEERLGEAERRVTEAEARTTAAVEAAAAERERAQSAVERLTEIQRQGDEEAINLNELQRREREAVRPSKTCGGASRL